MIKIIHAADLHLDSAFAALSEDKARERRAHQRTLVQRIVEIGEEEHADLILLSGDLFDGGNAYYETAEALSRAFAKSHAKIFIAPGNHDSYNPSSPYRAVRFPENVHIFTKESIEKVEIDELNCAVYGAGFTSNVCNKPLLKGFCADHEGLRIMVMHGEVANSPSNYNPISELDIAESNLHYLALGHVHSCSGMLRAGKTTYAYPGTPEGRGFDELGEKGIYIGTVSEEHVDFEFRKISPYLYTERIINVKNNEMENNLPENCEFEVCRLILQGECESVDIERLYKKLEARFYKLSIVDRTTAPHNIWEALEEESIKGQFLRRLKVSEADDEIIELAAAYGVAAIESREGEL